jgi:hypothetical protein
MRTVLLVETEEPFATEAYTALQAAGLEVPLA